MINFSTIAVCCTLCFQHGIALGQYSIFGMLIKSNIGCEIGYHGTVKPLLSAEQDYPQFLGPKFGMPNFVNYSKTYIIHTAPLLSVDLIYPEFLRPNSAHLSTILWIIEV